jgi:hypothetical protein
VTDATPAAAAAGQCGQGRRGRLGDGPWNAGCPWLPPSPCPSPSRDMARPALRVATSRGQDGLGTLMVETVGAYLRRLLL